MRGSRPGLAWFRHERTWYIFFAVLSSAISFAGGRYSSPLKIDHSVNNAQHARKRQNADEASNAASRPVCGGNRNEEAQYDTALHVGALLIILFVSSTACAFPLLALRFPKLRIPSMALFVIRHFGTGVLIATAFVHLLPTAFTSLGNPCLSSFWVDDYPAMPGAIALGAVFFVTMIEMIFSPARLLSASDPQGRDESSIPAKEKSKLTVGAESANNDFYGENIDAEAEIEVANYGHRITGRATSIARNMQIVEDHPQLEQSVDASNLTSNAGPNDDMSNSGALTPKQVREKAILQCTLLEAGILFHSIFIGMALSVTLGNDFVVLLIAIIFHQSCEGLALGARIASVTWEPRAIRPWIMALAYGCTTPLGQALGLATHTLYDPDSEVGLLVVGIFNAISAGLLTFASLVELLAEDFLSDVSWKTLRGRKRVAGFVLVFLGAFGMSVIGAWA